MDGDDQGEVADGEGHVEVGVVVEVGIVAATDELEVLGE